MGLRRRESLLPVAGKRLLAHAQATLLPQGKLPSFEHAAERILAVGRVPAFEGARDLLQSKLTPIGERAAHLVQRASAAYAAASFGPMVVQMALTSGATHSLGEVTSQLLARIADTQGRSLLEAEPLDLSSVRTFGLLGFVLHGPLSYCWYTLADASMVRYGRGLSPRIQTVALVCADQLAWGPAWVGASVFTLRVAKGSSLEGLLPFAAGLCVQGWALWIPAHAVTYGVFRSPMSRLMWVGAVEIAWVCLLASAVRGSAGGHGGGHDGAPVRSPPGEDRAAAVPAAARVELG